jgi:hypothetical protein
MALLDIFSTPTFLVLAIVLLLLSGIYLYISYKIAEQDHKLNSMLGLVSTLAEELQFIRNKVNYGNIATIPQIIDPLIPVSDDEYEDEEDDEETDDEGEYDDEDEDIVEQNEIEDNLEIKSSIKEIEFTDDLDEISEELIKQKLKYNPNQDYNIDIKKLNISNFNNIEEIKTIHLEAPIELENDDGILQEFVSSYTNNENDLVEDSKINLIKNDYKRMSLQKLRELIVERGIEQDPFKLKKNEIIKLLEE